MFKVYVLLNVFEDGARLERWQREEEELRERRRKLWEAKPSVSLQQVDVRQTPAQGGCYCYIAVVCYAFVP